MNESKKLLRKILFLLDNSRLFSTSIFNFRVILYTFDHEKLDVYRAAIEFVVLVDNIVEQFPRGRAYISDQLLRAGTSISLNIAEEAGEYSGSEKSRFYRMAKRSATECAGIFDICSQLRLVNEELFVKGRELLRRIVAMLIKMVQKTE